MARSFLQRATDGIALAIRFPLRRGNWNMKKISNLRKIGLLVLGSSFFLMNGCAHARMEKQIDDKVAQENVVKNRADLRAESADLIRRTSGLTEEQRQSLNRLKVETSAQLDTLSTGSLKLRAVLIHDLLQTPYNEDEVELIKERLTKIEDQRLTTMFSAVTQANQILGRQAMQNRAFVDGFFDGHGNRD
jgi:hypothetical protein